MVSKNTKFYSIILMTADFLVLLAAFTAAYILRVLVDNQRPLLTPVSSFDYLMMALTVLPLWILVFASLGLYGPQVYNRRLPEWGRILIGSLIGILIVIGWEYVTNRTFFPARLVALYSFGGAFILVLAERELMRMLRTLAFRYGIGISRVLIIGHSAATGDIANALASTGKSGYHVVAMATPKTYVPYRKGIVHYDDIDTALNSIKAQKINAIIQTDLSPEGGVNERILSAAQVNHLSYSFIPGEPEFYTGKNTVDVFLGYPMITVSQTPLIGWGVILKRLFDLFVVIITIPIWGFILLFVALLQKIFNPGPVFYKSTRLTRHRKPFGLYKFRSMGQKYGKKSAIDDFKAMGRADLVAEYKRDFKVQKDPRITRFGNFLRKSSLDELPQLINVLKGDISLVGPRPIPESELKQKFNEQSGALLHEVKGGLTGLWQVSGRNDISTEARIKLELYYVQNWSFWLDIRILLKTVLIIFSGRGAR